MERGCARREKRGCLLIVSIGALERGPIAPDMRPMNIVW